MTRDRTALTIALEAAALVETHYHVGPELVDRRYDVATLAQAAQQNRVTVVLKNHTYPTTPLAALARAHFGVQFLGSVVLNRHVGGLNPDAVYGAASGNRADPGGPGTDPRFVVYMPTVHATSHLRVFGHAFDQRWSSRALPSHALEITQPVEVFDDMLEPRPELDAVLRAIADTHAILATGHLAAAEIMTLVPLALAAGVTRVLITHPHYPSIDLSDDQLVTLTADECVFIEHCMAIHTIEDVPLEKFAASINATGPRQVVLTTDFGQVRSEPFPDGLFTLAAALYPLVTDDITLNDFVDMFSTNGARALDLARATAT